MRITRGMFGGRILAVPKTGDVRPTQDRVREAVFSMLAADIPGAAVVDFFAGTGAMGLEAASCGASRVAFIEQNPKHIECLKRNIAEIVPDGTAVALDVVRADVYRWIRSFSGRPFDIAFADPPYALGEERGYADFLTTLAARDILRADGGLFVAEMTAAQQIGDMPGWKLLRDRSYGKTRICLWRRI